MRAIVDALRDAVKGLLYPSEEDAPFEVVEWAVSAANAAEVRPRPRNRQRRAGRRKDMVATAARRKECG